jgi:hypothetical protein
MSCQHRSIDAQYIAYMTQNTSYYMNSCITLEYTDHEVLEVVKYTAEALQKTTLDATRACIMSKNVESSIALPSSGPPADFPVLRWVAIGPHELATRPAILRHFCNQQIHRQGLSN